MKIIEIFQDPGGQLSNVRVMSFLCLLYAFFINTYSLMTVAEIKIEIFYALMVAAFAPKVVQRFAERGQQGAGGGGASASGKEVPPDTPGG